MCDNWLLYNPIISIYIYCYTAAPTTTSAGNPLLSGLLGTTPAATSATTSTPATGFTLGK